MWKLKYEAPLGFRVNKGFDTVTTYSDLWFSSKDGKWKKGLDKGGTNSTHHSKPKSLKAFIRYLNRHEELKGVEVILTHRSYYKTQNGEIISLDVVANWED
jgi:hypothetical protein